MLSHKLQVEVIDPQKVGKLAQRPSLYLIFSLEVLLGPMDRLSSDTRSIFLIIPSGALQNVIEQRTIRDLFQELDILFENCDHSMGDSNMVIGYRGITVLASVEIIVCVGVVKNEPFSLGRSNSWGIGTGGFIG